MTINDSVSGKFSGNRKKKRGKRSKRENLPDGRSDETVCGGERRRQSSGREAVSLSAPSLIGVLSRASLFYKTKLREKRERDEEEEMRVYAEKRDCFGMCTCIMRDLREREKGKFRYRFERKFRGETAGEG